jgi:very-long-chain (3R)-3-hydroxyacyl-CoA dehydratase
MIVAWSLTEMVRYTFYALALLKLQSNVVTWLRYTLFYVLYPIGASSEVYLAYLAAPLAHKLHPLAPQVFYVIMMVYIPGFYVLYTYMIKQRAKLMNGKTTPPVSSRPRRAKKVQ